MGYHNEDRRANFCRLVFNGRPHIDAFFEAGWSKNNSRASANRIAKRYMKQEWCIKGLAELRKKADEAAVMTFQEKRERLAEIGRAKLTSFIDEEGNINLKTEYNGALAELVIEDWRGGSEDKPESRSKRIKLHSPLTAIDLDNKMMQVYQPEGTGTTINDHRTVNIYVESKDDKESLEWLKQGKLPEKVIGNE